MLTLRVAAELLAAANSAESLAPIAAAIGCPGQSAPIDAYTRHSLGLEDGVADARIASGPGGLRALMLVAAGERSLRELLPHLASRLASRTPHLLWIIIVTGGAAHEVAIAAWAGDRRPPRIAALVANRDRIIDSDAETLRALGAAATTRDLVTHARWVEILGREALTVRFYHALERCVAGISASSAVATTEARSEIALINVSRLLFLSFLEAKGWLDGDRAFLTNHFDTCLARGGGFHTRVLRPLFFGTLNTPRRQRAPAARLFGNIPFLNGGLFAPTALERRHRGLSFSDDSYGTLIYDLFAHFRFTAREESASWTEAAIDPEMLGRAFESLMASHERRRTGAFYTPFTLVEHVTSAGLDAVTLDDRASIERVTVLDPACGSGAFLVYVLEQLARRLADTGDTRDVCTLRRGVLTRSIFGVDVNPTAVWLCQLRLWLSVVIESDEQDPGAVAPLPNLDRNIRVGDALSGGAFGDVDGSHATGPKSHKLRERYARATGPRKESLARALDRGERACAVRAIDAELATLTTHRRDLLAGQRGRDLFGERHHRSRDERQLAVALRRRSASLRRTRARIITGGALPFSFGVHIADVAARGGFSLVVGNPPWVRLHRIPPEQRVAFRRDFEVARGAAWEAGAVAAGAGRGFAAQVDVAALFVERSIRLLAPSGAIALLVPAKLWRSLAGGGVRRLVDTETTLHRLDDFSEALETFDAAVYPSLIVASRGPRTASSPVRISVHHRGHDALTWCTPTQSIAFDESSGAPWLFLPPGARRAFDILRQNGVPLAGTAIGRPCLGVKSGCNEAFIVEVNDRDEHTASVTSADGRRITIESSMLRPLIRGEALRRWSVNATDAAIIWTHDSNDSPIATLPPLAARWLTRWRHTLVRRSDAGRARRWWSLFRTESARDDLPRVIWADVGREPRVSVLGAGDRHVPLNSCYIVRCPDETDAHTLAALLNGPLARAWLNALAEPARGGYRRYLGWTLSLVPLPADWIRARDILAPLSRRGHSGDVPRDYELLEGSRDAYGLSADDVAPLVAWATTT